jgi:hypothetical protein
MMTTEVITIGPPTQSLQEDTEPLGVQTFDEILMKFLRRKEALLAPPSRLRLSTGADAGACNGRAAAVPSHQEV